MPIAAFDYLPNFGTNQAAPAVPVPPPAGGVPPPGPGTTQQNWMDYLSQGFDPKTALFGEAGLDYYRRNRANEFFKTRGGHQLFDWFKQIYDKNPLAGRAFWQAMVGMGRGENDLQAATIHKMFGGDMNAYNTWLNELHHTGRENQAGNFDLVTGKWSNGGITNDWSWDSMGAGAWNPYTYQTGLQSLQGNDPATGRPYYLSGSESWNTYGAGQHFGAAGAQYATPQAQANLAAAGQSWLPVNQHSAAPPGAVPGTTPNIPVPKVPGRPTATDSVSPTVTAPTPGGPTTTNPGAGPSARPGWALNTMKGWRQ